MEQKLGPAGAVDIGRHWSFMKTSGVIRPYHLADSRMG
jgi:hypothetical protein